MNLVTVTKTNMINGMRCGCRNLTSTIVRIWHQVSRRACAEVLAALDVFCRPAQSSPLLLISAADLRRGLRSSKIVKFSQPNLAASWTHLHNCRCFQKHLKMLFQSLRALCKAPGVPRSIWKYLEALVRAAWESGRIECGFRTDLHFADKLYILEQSLLLRLIVLQVHIYMIKTIVCYRSGSTSITSFVVMS